MTDTPDPSWEQWQDDCGSCPPWKVHGEDRCIKPCPIHAPSDHALKDAPRHFRADRGIMERECEHGLGHHDPDDFMHDKRHGCDGCCDHRGYQWFAGGPDAPR